MVRLCVHRTNSHIYAQVIDTCGQSIGECVERRAGSTQGSPQRRQYQSCRLVGKRIAEQAKALGIAELAFDRSGFRYHGRMKALAEAARENGLGF